MRTPIPNAVVTRYLRKQAGGYLGAKHPYIAHGGWVSNSTVYLQLFDYSNFVHAYALLFAFSDVPCHAHLLSSRFVRLGSPHDNVDTFSLFVRSSVALVPVR